MIWRFADFEIDEQLRELRRGDEPVAVEPRVFDVLVYLIRNHDRVVGKEELFQRLWPGQFVSESALTYAIKAARRAVGDAGKEQRFIRNVHGVGYRFVAGPSTAPPHGEPAGPGRTPAALTPTAALYVGREAEMRQIRELLECAVSGRGAVLLLAGDAGIGKTRTADELVATARERGAQVLVARCYEGEGAPEFWAWLQILRAHLRRQAPEQVRELIAGEAAELSRLLPELAETGAAGAAAPTAEPERARFRVFEAVATFLRNAAARQPLVLVLDDLHWSDAASLLLFRFVAQNLGDAPLLLVGTYRDAEPARSELLASVAAAVQREAHARQIRLRGLGDEAVRELLRTLSGAEVPDSLVRTIQSRTEGNPFFVQEFHRDLDEAGVLRGPADYEAAAQALARAGVPLGAREIIRRRLARAAPLTREVLALAAVIGRDFELSVLRHAWLRQREDHVEVTREIALALDEALAMRLLQSGSVMPDHCRFVHVLIRETLYAELPLAQRAWLHRRVAEGIESVHGSGGGLRLAALAYHYLEAARGTDTARPAVDYARRAAEHAASLLAYEDAVVHYRQALEAVGLLPASSPVEHCELLLALGKTQWRTSEMAVPRETFRRAAEIARALPPESPRRAQLLARAALGFGRVQRMGSIDEELVELLEEAAAALPCCASPIRARVLASLARALFPDPHTRPRRVELTGEALAIARGLGEPMTLAWVLSNRHWALWGPDNVAERLGDATELVALAEREPYTESALQAHNLRFADLLELRRIDEADRELARCEELAARLRQPRLVWYVRCLRAMRTILAGDLEKGEELAREAHGLGRRTADPMAEHAYAAQQLALQVQQDRLPEMEGVARELSTASSGAAVWRCVLACIHARLGRSEAARAELRDLLADDLAAIPPDNCWLVSLAFLAEAAATLGDGAAARLLYERLLPYAGHNILLYVAMAAFGSVLRPLALLATALGRRSEAAAHFEAAIEHDRALGAVRLEEGVREEYARFRRLEL